MPSKRMVPSQELNELSDDMERRLALKDAEIAKLKDEIENLQSDADNDGSYITALQSAQEQICDVIGVERGTDHWPEFMERVKQRIAALTNERDELVGALNDMRTEEDYAAVTEQRDEARAERDEWCQKWARVTEQRARVVEAARDVQHKRGTMADLFAALDADAAAETERT